MPLPCDHHHVGLVAVDLGDVLAQPARGGAGVELGLDHDPAADDVQPAGEPQHRGDLGLAAAGLRDLSARQLGLHLCCHRHVADPFTRVNHPRTPSQPSGADQSAPMIRGVRRGQPHRVVPRGPVAAGDVGDHQLGADTCGQFLRSSVGCRDVPRRRARCARAGPERARPAPSGGPPGRTRAVSPACSLEVQHDHDAGVGCRPAPRAAPGPSGAASPR